MTKKETNPLFQKDKKKEEHQDATLSESLKTFPALPGTEDKVSELFAETPLSPPFAPNPGVRNLLNHIAEGSDYLWARIRLNPARARELLESSPHRAAEELRAAVTALADVSQENVLAAEMRRLKNEMALLTAFSDLGGRWNLAQTTAQLSAFADTCVQTSFLWLTREQISKKKLRAKNPEDPAPTLGMFILALGKHGAQELNYSSDIDLMFLFDPAAHAPENLPDAHAVMLKIGKKLLHVLNAQTEHGYVYRVDLRLRPDPGLTPIVISSTSAIDYYENTGHNWERAALIKARVIAGDQEAGERFLSSLRPFVWRKYLDYAALSDIRDMKRQINAFQENGQINPYGHDVKTGKGSIREIEFFAQAQQLVYGGRYPHLRTRQTCDALQKLADDAWVERDVAETLSDSYVFLRNVEHRIQMINDEQTHRLPTTDEAFQRFVRFCGFAKAETFCESLLACLTTVEATFNALFQESNEENDAFLMRITHPDAADDQELLEELRLFGFTKVNATLSLIQGWYFGRRSGVLRDDDRKKLFEILPLLLQSFADSASPDLAIAAFDHALNKLTAANELFALLQNHAGIRTLFAQILGTSPRLTEIIMQLPHVLDVIADPGNLNILEPLKLEENLMRRLSREKSFERFLELTRIFLRYEQFLLSFLFLSEKISTEELEQSHTDLAEIFLRLVLDRVFSELAKQYGVVEEGQLCVLAYGKFGAKTMTAGSDLDIVLIYDFPEGATSNGHKSLPSSKWCARLTQRLVTALSVPLQAGRLYEVDLRLRPSGNSGPVAVSFTSFEKYQKQDAQIWEHMALCRARTVAGNPELRARIETLIRQTLLGNKRDPQKIAKEIDYVRKRITKEKGTRGDFDLKLLPGGIMELDFLAQYVKLCALESDPELLESHSTRDVFRKASILKELSEKDLETLQNALTFFNSLIQYIHLTLDKNASAENQAEAFYRMIGLRFEAPTRTALREKVAVFSYAVHAIFQRIITLQATSPEKSV